MVSVVIVLPVLLINAAPMVGITEPNCTPPRARSVLAVVPKLYELPEFEDPLPITYISSSWAPPPDSVNNHPAGKVLNGPVPVEASVLKFWEYGELSAVKLIWAWERVHAKVTHAKRKYNFLIVHFGFEGTKINGYSGELACKL